MSGIETFDAKKALEQAIRQYPGLRDEYQPKILSTEQLMEFAIGPRIYIKEGKVGDYHIKIDVIKKGEPMTVVSARNWLMMGYKQQKVAIDTFRIIHKLFKGDQLLMSDSPQEMFLQHLCVENAKGKVLVGGLGLGLYANMVAQKDEVTEVVVVEISKDVIKLCRPTNPKIRVVCADIHDFIKTTKEQFDYAYIDIYYGTGAMEYINTVKPLKTLISKRFPNLKVDFWAEEEMLSQVDNR